MANAWALQSTVRSPREYIDMSAAGLDFQNTESYEFEIDFEITAQSSDARIKLVSGDSPRGVSVGAGAWTVDGLTVTTFKVDNFDFTTPSPVNFLFNTRYKLKIAFTTGTNLWEIFVDNVSVASINRSNSVGNLKGILCGDPAFVGDFNAFDRHCFGFNLYSVIIKKSDLVIAEYRNVVDANQTVFTDIAGGFNGAIVNHDNPPNWLAYTYTPVGPPNTAPTANAGADQLNLTQGSTVTLDATGSTDGDGTIASYLWTQTSGTPVTLSSTTVAQPTFTAPNSEETLVFQVEVTDDGGLTATDSVTISTAATPLVGPTANAGLDITADSGATITFDGSGSTAGDAAITSYAWAQTGGVETLTLTGANTAAPSANRPTNVTETLTFTLTVTDANGLTSTDTVQVNLVANVILSTDAWFLRNRSLAARLTFTNSIFFNSVTDTFKVTIDGLFASPSFSNIFQIIGSNSSNDGFALRGNADATIVDTFMIGNTSHPLIAPVDLSVRSEIELFIAQSLVSVRVNNNLVLDNIPFAGTLTSTLAFYRGGGDPRGTAYDLYGYDIEKNGVLIHSYEPIESQGFGTVLTDTVGTNDLILTNFADNTSHWVYYDNNTPPTAIAISPFIWTLQGSTTTLEAVRSSDDDGSIESYSWVQTAGTAVTIANPTAPTTTFVAPNVNGNLTFELTITDNGGLTATDTVTIEVVSETPVNQLPTAIPTAPAMLVGGGSFFLDGSASIDPDGQIASYQWAQVSGPTCTIVSPTSAITSVETPVVLEDQNAVFFLVVTDNSGGSSPSASISVEIRAQNTAPVANPTASAINVTSGDTVTLSGLSSTDDRQIVNYNWKQISGAYAKLNGRFESTATFTVPELTNRNAFAQDIYAPSAASTASNAIIPTALTKLLDITYAGAFRIDHSGGDSSSNWSVGTMGLSEDKLSLYFSSHSQDFSAAEFAIPTLSLSSDVLTMPVATALQDYTEILRRNSVNPVFNDRINGYLEHNGKLIVSSEKWYDGTGSNTHNMQVFSDADNIAGSTNVGLLQFEGAAYSAGWLSKTPNGLEVELGGTHLAGWSSVYSITARYSQGPSLYAWNADDAVNAVSGGEIVPSTPLMYYPFNNPLVENGSAYLLDTDPMWGSMAEAKVGFVIPNTRFFMAIGKQEGLVGGVGYKIQREGSTGTCSGACPFIIGDRANYYWLYDLDEILNATNPWDAKPISFGKWSHPFDNINEHMVVGGSFDEVNSRLYLTLFGAGQESADPKPLIVAYDIAPKVEDTTYGTDLTQMVFELEVTDNEGLKSSSTVTVSMDATVTPQDDIAPVITRLGLSSVTVIQGETYIDAGATAVDNVDGDLTNNIVTVNPVNTSALGPYTITYNVSDSTGNAATQVTRLVTVVAPPDVTAPVITVSGPATQTVPFGSPEPSFTSSTDDGSAVVFSNGGYNGQIPAAYTFTFNAIDAAGNVATQVTRTVIVQEEVVVTPAPTVSIATIPELTDGDTGTATATTTNTTSVAWSATGAVSINASTGDYTVNSAGAWSITATATGDGGSSSDTVSGTAVAPPAFNGVILPPISGILFLT